MNKTEKTPVKTQKPQNAAFENVTLQPSKTALFDQTREAVNDAFLHMCKTLPRVLIAGHLLREVKETLPHGEFGDWCKANLPVSKDTCERWMNAAANVLRALPPIPEDVIDVEVISVSRILTSPDEELPEPICEWKQKWRDWTADKTIKDCLMGVLFYGDPDHRVDRAVNGKTLGGAGGDRKDFPLFVVRKLRDTATHLSHWDGMNEVQRTEVKEAFRSAIIGDVARLRGRDQDEVAFSTGWPVEICHVVIEAIKERMRTERK